MKKLIIMSSIATLLAFFAVVSAGAIVSAQGYVFASDLKLGSTGSDVVALQTTLISGGFHIPFIESGSVIKGRFGSQTKKAVQQYQSAHSISATGFVGPITRKALNSNSLSEASTMFVATSTPVAMSTSVTSSTTTSLSTTTPPVVIPPAVMSTTGAVGTLAVSLWSTPSGIVAYKGQSYDVAAYKVQASASDMAIQNLTLDFDVRLWLYASAITIKDDSGAVIGSVTNLNQGNFSELTVGSDYRVSVPVNGYVVKAVQTKYLYVNISFLPTSDRTTGTVNVLQAQIRSVDGTGVTDTETAATARSFTYQGSGAGSIIVTTDSASPATGQVQLSTSAQTNGVVLGIFDIKSQNAPSTMQNLSIGIHTNGPGNVSSLFSNIQVKIGNQTYSANNICTDNTSSGCIGTNSTTASSTVIFNNMTVALPADVYVPITVMANIAVDTNNQLDGTIASTTLSALGSVNGPNNNPSVIDQSYNTLAVNTAVFTSNNLTFTGSSVTVSGPTVTYGGQGQTQTGSTTQQYTFNFSITAGNNPIYLSANPSVALSMTNTVTSGVMTFATSTFNDNNSSGDSSGTYFYLAPGQTKTFQAINQATGSFGAAGTSQVTSINYGTTTTALSASSLSQSSNQQAFQATLFH